MGEARKHHFISQCYLKGFTKNGSKNSLLFVADLESGKTFETRPENVAQRRDFNRVEGRPAGEIEGMLGQFERQADNALRKIASDRSLDDRDAWNAVLNLIALFAVRHPLQRENVRNFMARIATITMEMATATPERWASQLSQAQAAGYVEKTDVTYNQVRQFLEDEHYEIEVPTARHLQFEFAAFPAVLETLGARRWDLLLANPNAGSFVTSDRPVALLHACGWALRFLEPATRARTQGHTPLLSAQPADGRCRHL